MLFIEIMGGAGEPRQSLIVRDKMTKVASILAIILCVFEAPSAAFEMGERKPVTPEIARADNACALFATVWVTDMRSQTMSKEDAFKICNAHPVTSECKSTWSFIVENLPADKRKIIPVLTCDGSLADLPPLPKPAPRPVVDEKIAAADQACAAAASEILTGMRSQLGNLATTIQRCNGHPTKQACISIRDFVRDNNGGKVPPEFTCSNASAR
jgi:hypothetical protein